LILSLADAGKLDKTALERLGARAVTRSDGGRVHLLVDQADAAGISALLQPA
jgi:hypothetical protein